MNLVFWCTCGLAQLMAAPNATKSFISVLATPSGMWIALGATYIAIAAVIECRNKTFTYPLLERIKETRAYKALRNVVQQRYVLHTWAAALSLRLV